jgi:hypothetical protein
MASTLMFTDRVSVRNSLAIYIGLNNFDRCRCRLFWLDDGSGQLNLIDTADGSSTPVGAPLGASVTRSLALSPSDAVTYLFGSTGTRLVRISAATGQATTIANNVGFQVSVVDSNATLDDTHVARFQRRSLTIWTMASSTR